MEEAKFQRQMEKLRKPTGPRGTWVSPVFALEEYKLMTPNQLGEVIVEMMKFSSLGSYWLRGDLFDLIDCLDTKVSIPEDPQLEKYLHMTASLVCLTQFQGFPINEILPGQPKRLGKHLERIIGPEPLNVPSMETEPSLQIATFLAYPLLEGVVRRKLGQFISAGGTVQKEFHVLKDDGEPKKYKPKDRINNLNHELQLLQNETSSASLRTRLSRLNEAQPLFEDIYKWRWQLLHGALTASWHSLTLLLLTYLVLLET
jgi:hypothetical protein